jgi:hypothetical protein
MRAAMRKTHTLGCGMGSSERQDQETDYADAGGSERIAPTQFAIIAQIALRGDV